MKIQLIALNCTCIIHLLWIYKHDEMNVCVVYLCMGVCVRACIRAIWNIFESNCDRSRLNLFILLLPIGSVRLKFVWFLREYLTNILQMCGRETAESINIYWKLEFIDVLVIFSTNNKNVIVLFHLLKRPSQAYKFHNFIIHSKFILESKDAEHYTWTHQNL